MLTWTVLPFALWADVSFRMIVPTNEIRKADDLRLEHWSRICDINCIGLNWIVEIHIKSNLYWAVQKNLVKGCRQTLYCYCVSCELLSASIADALWFVNMVCLPLIAERNAHEICLTQECLQIVRRLLWKRTTTHSLRNNNPMFDGNLWPNSFEQPSTF